MIHSTGQRSESHVYEVRPRSDKRGVDLISDALHLVACGTASQARSAIQSATRSFSAVHMMAAIRVCDEADSVIETHEHAGEFKEP